MLFPLVRSYIDFLLSFDYPLRVIIPFKVIAKASRTRVISNTLQAPEMLTMKTSCISHVLLLELKYVSRDRSMKGNLLKPGLHTVVRVAEHACDDSSKRKSPQHIDYKYFLFEINIYDHYCHMETKP